MNIYIYIYIYIYNICISYGSGIEKNFILEVIYQKTHSKYYSIIK